MPTELHLALTLWRYGLLRARQARAPHLDRGATALEWAVISMILLTAAIFIGGVVYRVVQDRAAKIDSCGSAPVGADGC